MGEGWGGGDEPAGGLTPHPNPPPSKGDGVKRSPKPGSYSSLDPKCAVDTITAQTRIHANSAGPTKNPPPLRAGALLQIGGGPRGAPPRPRDGPAPLGTAR